MMVSGIYKKKFLKKNSPISAVAQAVINEADLSVAHDLIFNAVLTNTAVDGAMPKNHQIRLVIHNHCTSCSLSNHSFVIFVAIFAETMVSTMAIIAITHAVLNNHASNGTRFTQDRFKSAVGNAINEKLRSGYLSCRSIKSQSHR